MGKSEAETRPLAGIGESTVVREAQGGNPEAFGELYQRYVARIYNYLYHRVGHQPAEDLTSETFTRALRHIDGYRTMGEAPFGAWLYRIARNCLCNWVRDEERGRGRKWLPLEESDRHLERGLVRRGVDERETEEAVLAKIAEEERQDKLRRGIRSLTLDQYAVLSFKLSGGLTNAQIGQVLGRSGGAVKSLYHRALRNLREEIGEE